MPLEIQGNKYYTIPEVALELHVTPQTVRNWIKQGKLTGRRIGKPILIREDYLKQFIGTA